ncbi:MAG: Homoisocitrate dehydrogenase [Methanosaeta sp. PtaU1.Bin112]|nr:MAG: Homoisocitrate dehydrogenase [Methanosaeta sp. PtaU1.Bin112]
MEEDWPFQSQSLDFVVARENTEGLHSGQDVMDAEQAHTMRVMTRLGSERIAEMACDLAAGRRTLIIAHMSNVLKGDWIFLKTCQEVAARRAVPCDEMLVAAYNLVTNPGRFDVLVTTNLFGDILSDEAAGVIGSLGLCASANIGTDHALFESIHPECSDDDALAGRARESRPNRGGGAEGAGQRGEDAGPGRELWDGGGDAGGGCIPQ